MAELPTQCKGVAPVGSLALTNSGLVARSAWTLARSPPFAAVWISSAPAEWWSPSATSIRKKTVIFIPILFRKGPVMASKNYAKSGQPATPAAQVMRPRAAQASGCLRCKKVTFRWRKCHTPSVKLRGCGGDLT